MKIFKKIKGILLLAVIVTIFNCENDKDASLSQEKAKISVRLMDEPGDYDHVFIEVIDVMVKINDENNDAAGWESLEAINTGIYDLLELTGGIDVLLVDDYEIPSGTLNQIRLILGEDNTIVIDGETLPLRTPSAQQSGLKIQVNETIEADFSYTFLLDFNVDESIVIAGNSGNINLKPVIRATVEATTGVINGTIDPMDVITEISATNGIYDIATYADGNGQFTLVGLSSGSYSVTITPDINSVFQAQVIENVQVNVGEVTELGQITLE